VGRREGRWRGTTEADGAMVGARTLNAVCPVPLLLGSPEGSCLMDPVGVADDFSENALPVSFSVARVRTIAPTVMPTKGTHIRVGGAIAVAREGAGGGGFLEGGGGASAVDARNGAMRRRFAGYMCEKCACACLRGSSGCGSPPAGRGAPAPSASPPAWARRGACLSPTGSRRMPPLPSQTTGLSLAPQAWVLDKRFGGRRSISFDGPHACVVAGPACPQHRWAPGKGLKHPKPREKRDRGRVGTG